MAKGKSTWKYNKLLTARRNYFVVGGPMGGNPSPIMGAIALNNPGFATEVPGLAGVYVPPTTPTAPETRAVQQEVNLGKTTTPTTKKATSGDAKKDTNTDWGMGGIAGGVGFLANGITNMANNINAGDVKAKKEQLLTATNNAQMRGQSANDSFDALANDMATTAMLKKVDKYDLGAKKAGAIAVEGLTEGLKGSMAGFSAGSAIEGMAGGSGGAQGPALSQGGDGQLAALMGAYGGRLGKAKFSYGGPMYPMNEDEIQANKYMGGGPIGAIVGGVLGTGMSLVGNLIRNHKAKKAAKEVNEQIKYTNAFNERSMVNRAENLGADQLATLEANYAAYGGPLGLFAPVTGAIEYDFMNDLIEAKRLAAQGYDDTTSSLPNSFAGGGDINIKPSKKGTFTAAATKHGMGVQEFARKVLANKEDYSPAMVKKANFARNASKWHHAFGGELNTHGADFTNGLLAIGNGGSHEENPFEGVPMGVDPEGTPNLVEEGETIFNDYVFSKRLKVPKAIRKKYNLRGTKSLSFADASKQLAKESEERPNDPISQRGMQALMADLANAQEELKAKNERNSYANGGEVKKFDIGGNKQIATEGLTESEAWSRLMAPQIKQRLRDIAAIEDVTARKQAATNFMNTMNPLQTSYGNDVYGKTTWGGSTVKGGKAHQQAWQGAGLNTYAPEDYGYVFQDRGRSQDVNDTWVDNLIGNHTILRNAGMAGYNPADIDEIRALSQAVGLDYATNGTSNPLMWWSEAAQAPAPQTPGPGTPEPPVEPTTPAERKRASRYYYNTGTADDPNYVLVDSDNAPLWLRNNKYYYRNSSDVAEGDTDYTDYYYDPEEGYKQGKYADWLRYAPAVGFGIGALTDALGITNKPDYSNADALLEATRGAEAYRQVRWNPIGNYLAYKPFDRDYYLNKQNAEAGASRRAISQNAGLNRGAAMAGILAGDKNYLEGIGSLARQAEEYNLAQRERVEDFNRQTNITNSQGFLQADIANQKALMDSKEFALKGLMAGYDMRERARQASDAARSANISGLFQTLGDIGYEERNAKMRDWAILHGVFGPGTEDYGRVRKAAKGGKLKRRKRGLTI